MIGGMIGIGGKAAMDSWQRQVLIYAFVIAILGVAAVTVNWLPVQLGAVLGVLVILYLALRNPATIYRRLFRIVVLAGVGWLAIGGSGEIQGSTSVGGVGQAVFRLAWGSTPWVAILFLALLCLVGDLFLTSREDKRRKTFFPDARMTLGASAIGTKFMIQHDFALSGPPEGLTLVGATLRLSGVFWREVEAKLLFLEDGVEHRARSERPAQIDAGRAEPLILEIDPAAGTLARRLSRRSKWPLFKLLPISGLLRLDVPVGKTALSIPIRVTLQKAVSAAPR
jgi:hypothetical protein